MKKLSFIISLATGIFFGTVVSAQTKIGHVNSAELVTLMPESKTADMDLQKFVQSLEGQLKTMGTEYQGKIEEYQSKESLMADAIKQTKEKEIRDLQTRIQEFQQSAQESMQKKKEELYSPIFKKLQETIDEVAKENGYNYILDSSLGVVLFKQESNDIGPIVKKKLGLPMASAAAPEGAGKPAGNTPAKPPVKKH